MAKTVNFKLVLLGDTAVGKSSSVERFVKNEFFEFQQPTIGSATTPHTPAVDPSLHFAPAPLLSSLDHGTDLYLLPLCCVVMAGMCV